MNTMRVNPIAPLPMRLLDPVKVDVGRIVFALETLHFRCSDAQAEIIRSAIYPLPLDEDALIALASQYVQVDWNAVPERVEPVLRELKARYDQYDAGEDRGFTERQILAATSGLDEHPGWWGDACMPCCCDACLDC